MTAEKPFFNQASRRTVWTVFFSDLKNFSSHSETLAHMPRQPDDVRHRGIVLKNSKIAGSEDLANVAHWRFLPLQGVVESIRGPAIAFAVIHVVPSPRSERDAPAVLGIFGYQRKRTFSTQTGQSRHPAAAPRLPFLTEAVIGAKSNGLSEAGSIEKMSADCARLKPSAGLIDCISKARSIAQSRENPLGWAAEWFLTHAACHGIGSILATVFPARSGFVAALQF
jgi:hypothetical protein